MGFVGGGGNIASATALIHLKIECVWEWGVGFFFSQLQKESIWWELKLSELTCAGLSYVVCIKNVLSLLGSIL